MAFPSTLTPTLKTDWADATPVATTHPDEHNSVATDVEALKAKVGIDGSAVTTSLDYKLKSTSSISPGHKHALADITDYTSVSNGSTAAAGVFEEGTAAEINAGTATGGTGARLAVSAANLAASNYATFLPTTSQKDALAGTGTPSSSNKYVTADTIVLKAANADIQTFTANGTWTKPSGAKMVHVVCYGSGGGGAGGGLAGTTRGGGAGGGGQRASMLFNATDLSATETVTIGTAGTGGAAQTSGGDGNETTFGTKLKAYGGKGGTNAGVGGNGGGIGTASSTAAGNIPGTGGSAAAGNYGDFAGAGGGGATNIGGAAGFAGGSAMYGATGGGGGACGDGGGTGGTGGAGGSLLTTTAGGGAAGGAGGAPGAAGTAGTAGSFERAGTGGGGGGGGNTSQSGGAGGAGGAAGGGGGGGGGNGGGGTAGAGGAGGSGACYVVTYF
jgi:hypothetical protein